MNEKQVMDGIRAASAKWTGRARTEQAQTLAAIAAKRRDLAKEQALLRKWARIREKAAAGATELVVAVLLWVEWGWTGIAGYVLAIGISAAIFWALDTGDATSDEAKAAARSVDDLKAAVAALDARLEVLEETERRLKDQARMLEEGVTS